MTKQYAFDIDYRKILITSRKKKMSILFNDIVHYDSQEISKHETKTTKPITHVVPGYSEIQWYSEQNHANASGLHASLF